MRIVLTGATGRFGTMFREVAAREGHEVLPCGPHPGDTVRFDIQDPKAPDLRALRADWVLHAAAWTDVDGCERDPARARVMNVEATSAIARSARAAGARLLYVSTDYVFDGAQGDYREEDEPNPVSVYGATKLEGEAAALAEHPNAVVARTSVVFGTPGKPDAVTWLAGKVRQGQPFEVVDQTASPTSTGDLARQALGVMQANAEGLYHAAGADQLSRLGMAQVVADALGLPCHAVAVPISSISAWTARRPHDSSLNVQKVARHATPVPFGEAVRNALEAAA